MHFSKDKVTEAFTGNMITAPKCDREISKVNIEKMVVRVEKHSTRNKIAREKPQTARERRESSTVKIPNILSCQFYNMLTGSTLS